MRHLALTLGLLAVTAATVPPLLSAYRLRSELASSSSHTRCMAAFTIRNGMLHVREEGDIVLRVLGSHARLRSTEIAVRLSVSTDGGNSWRALFAHEAVTGGEHEILRRVPAESRIALRAEGESVWQFARAAESGDAANRIRLFQNGEPPPPVPIFSDPPQLRRFLQKRVHDGRIVIPRGTVLALVELGPMDQTADFQDVALLVKPRRPACRSS